MVLSSVDIFADVGLTHQYKQKRAEILSTIDAAENDSIKDYQLIDSLQDAVISLDILIMKSYEETVDRMAAEKRERGSNARFVVLITLITTALAILMVILLLMARKRVVKSGSQGLLQVYRELTADFVNSVEAEKTSTRQLLRVNVVVLAGLIIMSISVIAFLLRTL